ncbi:MAG: family 10 glycosylhydrolase [Clostridiales bacterium]|nr:family 10 glycosylhydrolase [Clostridiales bacterium]
MNFVRRQLPWLILIFAALSVALAIALYGISLGIFFAQGSIFITHEADITSPSSTPHMSAFTENTVLSEENATIPSASLPEPALLPQEMRGVWIATVLNIDFPKQKGDYEAQKKELIAILDTAQAAGLNTVFFQVRPQGDAFYLSQIFPWSQYLSGIAGVDPGYDPLAFIIEQAHSRNLALHAWVNPYRLSMGSKSAPQNTVDDLPAASPLKNRPDLTLAAGDGRLYLNPGEPEAMALVLAGIREILENYAVDGIHLDDYFYPPDPNYDDSATYAKYANDLSLADWRRANTQTLIELIQALVREVRPQSAFGVSPSGIWRNNSSSSLGSETNGFESYSQIYADTRGWVKEGLLDYIAPQLYWAIGKEGSDYAHLVRWWADVCRDTGVCLYIGQGAYRVGSSGEAAWSTADEIERQLVLNRELGITGSIFYGYQQISENTQGLQDLLQEFYMYSLE